MQDFDKVIYMDFRKEDNEFTSTKDLRINWKGFISIEKQKKAY